MRFHLVIDATCVDGVSRRAYQTQVCGEMHHAMALVYVCEYCKYCEYRVLCETGEIWLREASYIVLFATVILWVRGVCVAELVRMESQGREQSEGPSL